MSNPVTETATRIYAAHAEPQTIARAHGDAWKSPLWDALEAAGLPLAWVPEDFGGVGAGFADGFEIARISGSFASPAPLAETLLAGWLLAQAEIPAPAGPMTVAPTRTGDAITVTANGKLAGRARAVPFARDVQHFAVLATSKANPVTALVDSSKVRFADRTALAGIPVADVILDDVVPEQIAATKATPATLMQMGATLRACETAGALAAILDMTTAYAQERVAFGKPLSKFQAIQHNLARLAGEAAAALTASGSAADAIAAIDADPARFDEGVFLEAAAARIRSAEAATEGAAIAHQVHGAIGFTQEHALRLYTLRLLSWRDDFGNESRWAADLGRRVAARGADALWPMLAAR